MILLSDPSIFDATIFFVSLKSKKKINKVNERLRLKTLFAIAKWMLFEEKRLYWY